MSEKKKPDWQTAGAIQKDVGLSRHMLSSWHREGWVRALKVSDSQQGTRLFSTLDVERTLGALSRGEVPKLSQLAS
jgi:DNA-binding transcriptional MerR regulator